MEFSTYHQLNKHKQRENHKRDRKRAAENDFNKMQDIKKRSKAEKDVMKKWFFKRDIQQTSVLVDRGNSSDEENMTSSDEELEKCSHANCKLEDFNAKQKEKIEWVQCDMCDSWWHNYCIDMNKKLAKNKVFICSACK